MTQYPFTAETSTPSRLWDTPTICNGLEIVAPERRAIGFTVEPMVSRRPQVAADRGPRPHRDHPRQRAAARAHLHRARTGTTMSPPTASRPIAVIQDVDDRPGFGAFWGEVHTTVHAALGVAGCVTNGSFRDIDMLAPGLPDRRRPDRPEPRACAYGADELRREHLRHAGRATTT